MDRATHYTVKQLAALAGVSARTLHYYDEIGLLVPRRNPANDYREYGREELLRLQQILFLRELGMPLEEIGAVIDRPGFELLAALEQHWVALVAKQERLSALIRTVEHTMDYLKGLNDMDGKDLFQGFSDEQQAQYEEEAARRWGDSRVKESQKRWGSYSKEKQQQIKEEGGQVYVDMVAAMPLGPQSPQAQACVERWANHMRYFYEPTREIMLGLADGYVDDPEFRAFFDRIHPELAPFLREAIRVYCKAE